MRYFSVLIALLLGHLVNGQEDKKEEVYLKDGSVLVGHILEDTDYAIKILLGSGDTLDIGYKYVESIGVKERRKSSFIELAPRFHKEQGILFQLSLNSIYSDVETGSEVALNVAKRFGPRINVGGGVAYTTWANYVNWIYVRSNYIPVYAYGRYYFNDKLVRLFTSAKLGYGLALNNNNFFFQGTHDLNGGMFSQASLGIHIANRRKVRVLIALTGNYQRATGRLEGIDWNTNLPFVSDYRAHYIRPGLSIGVEF